MVLDKNIKEFVAKLTAKTEYDKIPWEKESGEDQFGFYTKKGGVTIDNYVDLSETDRKIELVIWEKSGDIIAKYNVSYKANREDFNYLESFHSRIKYFYYKVDQFMKEILGEVDNNEFIKD
jgi:hypothetical protein